LFAAACAVMALDIRVGAMRMLFGRR